MNDLRDLLRQHGAPAPNAMAMPGETRSDDGLFFEVVHNKISPTPDISTIAEWCCMMDWKQVEALQAFLNANFAATGKKPEVLFDDAMAFLGIGTYIGTYLGKHTGGAEVRMLLSYTPGTGKTMEQIYQTWGNFLANPPAGWGDAVAAISQIRKFWLGGTERTQAGLMMLTGVDLGGRLQDTGKFPFASVDRA
jgi:hypothetical protein